VKREERKKKKEKKERRKENKEKKKIFHLNQKERKALGSPYFLPWSSRRTRETFSVIQGTSLGEENKRS